MNQTVDDYIRHNGDNLWTFETVPSLDFENINHIHPLKQRDIASIIESVKDDIHIIGIIIWGSSVRFDCHSTSDIDLLIIRDDNKMQIDGNLENVQSELDIIFNCKLGRRLQEEIAQTGVIVYRRKNYV